MNESEPSEEYNSHIYIYIYIYLREKKRYNKLTKLIEAKK